ncbi:hypothetical protein CERSUDRAFT_97438 [Gelatoporia subvermispora B]|uniref:Uncharacterized protein n=1 Tax=Ceriporiopsis subvermispora (strain B) TaxID=914234 RepID=M2PFY3_CERS8|nr:hypothetical protein CERSUDRAFT_97438 [Gelatoporia subvermispora B]
MLASSFLLAALAIPAALAGPTLRFRQSGCQGGVFGEIDTAANITLNALDSNAANSGGQGLPLVALVTSDVGVETLYVLATQATAGTGSNTISEFSLNGGSSISGLAPIVPNTFSANLNVESGQVLEFASGDVGQEIPADEYCGIANIAPNGQGTPIPEPLLSLRGDTDDFALCMSGDLDIVVFQPTADNGGAYSFDSCTSVDILIFEH